MKCIECDWLAGSERKMNWLLAEGKYFCDHPDREGGPWNVLQNIVGYTRCKRFIQAPQEKIEKRLQALELLRKRYEKTSPSRRSRLA